MEMCNHILNYLPRPSGGAPWLLSLAPQRPPSQFSEPQPYFPTPSFPDQYLHVWPIETNKNNTVSEFRINTTLGQYLGIKTYWTTQ